MPPSRYVLFDQVVVRGRKGASRTVAIRQIGLSHWPPFREYEGGLNSIKVGNPTTKQVGDYLPVPAACR